MLASIALQVFTGFCIFLSGDQPRILIAENHSDISPRHSQSAIQCQYDLNPDGRARFQIPHGSEVEVPNGGIDLPVIRIPPRIEGLPQLGPDGMPQAAYNSVAQPLASTGLGLIQSLSPMQFTIIMVMLIVMALFTYQVMTGRTLFDFFALGSLPRARISSMARTRVLIVIQVNRYEMSTQNI